MKRELEDRLARIDALLDETQGKLEKLEQTARSRTSKYAELQQDLMRKRKEFVTLEHRVKDADGLVDDNKRLQGQQNQASESLRRILELSKTLAKEFRQ